MYCKKYFTITFLSLTFYNPFINAATMVQLQEVPFDELQQHFSLAIPGNRGPLNQTGNTFQFIQQRRDKNKIIHVRMQQEYLGFPVFGGYAIFHSALPSPMMLTPSNEIKMNGVMYKELETELGHPPASFMKNKQAALNHFKANYQHLDVSEEEVTPMVYIDQNHQAFWAYKVSVFVQHEDQIPERPTAIIDAKTYVPFEQWNEVKTIRSQVKGTGYGGNSQVPLFLYGERRPFLFIARDNSKGVCYMENKGVKVVDMEHRYKGNQTKPMQFNCAESHKDLSNTYWTGYQADGYDVENGAFSPSNDALYVGYIIQQMYHQWYGLPPLLKAGKPMQLVMRVHYGIQYANAFWDGRQMTFGDGNEQMHPLVSIGIGAHEISHGFTQQHSNLMYVGQSGGMNEAFSDMAAQAAEFYADENNSWEIGREIMKNERVGKPLRYMDRPSRDGASIDNAREYYHGLDVHHSSGVYNRLFYLLAHSPNWNTRVAFNVMVKANMDYWTPYSTFEDGACGVINAAQDLGLSTDTVRQALDEVGIHYQRCAPQSFVGEAG